MIIIVHHGSFYLNPVAKPNGNMILQLLQCLGGDIRLTFHVLAQWLLYLNSSIFYTYVLLYQLVGN